MTHPLSTAAALAALLAASGWLAPRDHTREPVAHVGPSATPALRNERLGLVVETGPDLRTVTLTATFTFSVTERDSGRLWFTFPPVDRPDQLARITLDGASLAAADLGVAAAEGGARFLLPASLSARPGPHQLVVTGAWPSEPRVDFTHWGSWHPYLGSRANPVPITLEVRTDTTFQVVSSGTHVADTTNGSRRVAHWRTTVPQGWVFLSVGRYRQADLVEQATRLVVLWPADHEAFSSDLVSREPFRVLAFLRNAFGPPTTDRVTLIEIPGDSVNNFAVDGLVAISRGSYRRIEQSGTYLSAMLAHELAHLWWGDLVNPVGPGARWLTEGFAEYSRYLYERATGGESLAWSYRNLVMVRQFAGREPPPLAGNPAEGEDEAIYYQKGAFVLRMLAGEIGDDALVAAMRRLAERRRGQTATLDDFVAAVGVDRLNWFFDQWLRRPTGPRLRLSVSTAEARGDSVVVRGMIEQAMPAYRLSLPLVAYSTRDTSMQSIQVAGPRTAFTLRLTRRPGWRLVVDPDGTVFQWFTREELPVDFAAAAQVISERRCVDTKAPADTTLARRLREFLAHRFPNTDTADPRCPVRLLVGRDAEEFRRRQAPGVPEPVVGTVSAFVKREPGGQGLIIGIEGDADHWPDLLVPEAPLTFLRVRSGQIVAAWGAGLPRIEVPLPHDAPSDSARD